MSSSSPQRWICRACNSRNTAQFSRCIACDCINPETLYPKTFAAATAAIHSPSARVLGAADSSTAQVPPQSPPNVRNSVALTPKGKLAAGSSAATDGAKPPSPAFSGIPIESSSASAPVSVAAARSAAESDRLSQQLERAAEVNRALTAEVALRDERICLLERDNLAQREELNVLCSMLVAAQQAAHRDCASLTSSITEATEDANAVKHELELVKEELRQLQSQPREESLTSAAQQQPAVDGLVREISSFRSEFQDSRREEKEILQQLVTAQQARGPASLQAENSLLQEKCAALQKQLDEVTKQRNDFAHDARFNLALLAECREERASLKAQLLLDFPAARSPSNSAAAPQESPAPASAVQTLERVAELQKLVSVLEGQVESVERSKREAVAALESRLESASFLEDQLRSAQFGTSELKKQCDTLREKIATKDFDIAEGARHLAEAEKKLLAERDFHDRARKDVTTLEKQLEVQTEEWRARVESLNRQLNEHQAAQSELLERYDALEITVEDLRVALADALEALSARGEETS
jgi:chromosome segregation ATPase